MKIRNKTCATHARLSLLWMLSHGTAVVWWIFHEWMPNTEYTYTEFVCVSMHTVYTIHCIGYAEFRFTLLLVLWPKFVCACVVSRLHAVHTIDEWDKWNGISPPAKCTILLAAAHTKWTRQGKYADKSVQCFMFTTHKNQETHLSSRAIWVCWRCAMPCDAMRCDAIHHTIVETYGIESNK